MKILVVGGGAREHAYVWKIAQSPLVKKIYAAPGNIGMAADAECIDLAADDIEQLAAFAQNQCIDLTVVGPEVPLAAGICDLFARRGLMIFGPSQAAAQIETSKEYALGLMHKYGIPTGQYRSFTDPDVARASIEEWRAPFVLKASGLAGGRGVVICQTREEALHSIDQIMREGIMGAAGQTLVLMEYLEGEEASVFGFSDGENLICLMPAQDHKPIGEGDTGPMTGGMGAYAPAPVITPQLQQQVYDQIMLPTIRALKAEGRPYTGILYGGLIITAQGPKVIEFNGRLGDPEAQVVLPLLKTDLVEIMLAACQGRLDQVNIAESDRAAACIVLSSQGYPTLPGVPLPSAGQGVPITGLDTVAQRDDILVFHADTGLQDGQLATNGGRIVCITGLGDDVAAAIGHAYEAVDQINFKGKYCRRDIGHRALGRLGQQ
ncbi:MAG: phosphoribosylamine--glycine ligase [Candidatus Latescibacteria bacterium]|nr:phosphoribosylamine--glycine ligase [Candidatus Latescibacterota bacterium]